MAAPPVEDGNMVVERAGDSPRAELAGEDHTQGQDDETIEDAILRTTRSGGPHTVCARWIVTEEVSEKAY